MRYCYLSFVDYIVHGFNGLLMDAAYVRLDDDFYEKHEKNPVSNSTSTFLMMF